MAIPYFQRVIKVGDSLAVIIPAPIRNGLEIQRGDAVALSAPQSDLVCIKLYAAHEVERLRLPIPDIT